MQQLTLSSANAVAHRVSYRTDGSLQPQGLPGGADDGIYIRQVLAVGMREVMPILLSTGPKPAKVSFSTSLAFHKSKVNFSPGDYVQASKHIFTAELWFLSCGACFYNHHP